MAALAAASIWALTAQHTHSAEYDQRPALQKGPQFAYLWTEEDCQMMEMALSNQLAVPWEGLLKDNDEMQRRQVSIIAKCRRSGVIWRTENGEEFRRLVQFSLPEQILAGFALTRYNCRKVTDPKTGNEYGDDGSEEASWDTERCEQLNQWTKRLFEQVRNPSMRTFGGNPDAPPPWTILHWATAVVLSWH
jgi:hypothetical protein